MMFADKIKEMFQNAEQKKLVASIPIEFANPINNTKVRFWTRKVMSEKGAVTTKENSLVGEFRDNLFWVETDNWSVSEIFSWTKLEVTL